MQRLGMRKGEVQCEEDRKSTYDKYDVWYRMALTFSFLGVFIVIVVTLFLVLLNTMSEKYREDLKPLLMVASL